MRRLLPRLGVLVLLVGGLVAGVPATADADVVFDATAQEALGVDEDGNPTDPGPLSSAWTAFTSTCRTR